MAFEILDAARDINSLHGHYQEAMKVPLPDIRFEMQIPVYALKTNPLESKTRSVFAFGFCPSCLLSVGI